VIDIEAAGDQSLDIRDAFIELGLPAPGLFTHRNDRMDGVAVRVRLPGLTHRFVAGWH